jgi:four helix bundle protein
MSRIAGDLKQRSLGFGVQAVQLARAFPNNSAGWVVGKQLIRAATSIGANVWEADVAPSDADFANKMSIARKEANEVAYWIALAQQSGLIGSETADTLSIEATELVNILSTVVRKTQEHIRRG